MSSLPLFPEDILIGPVGETVLGPLREKASQCTACTLRQHRTQVVFGAGNGSRPPVAFVGEAPGQFEDERGLPFVGPSGALLTRMIASMGLTREDVYLCTTVQCRTPNGRKPDVMELSACRDFLVGQLRGVKPLTIVTLGETAVHSLVKSAKKLPELRGKWYEWEGIPVRPTYHPAYLLRPEGKDARKDARIDLEATVAKINELKRDAARP